MQAYQSEYRYSAVNTYPLIIKSLAEVHATKPSFVYPELMPMKQATIDPNLPFPTDRRKLQIGEDICNIIMIK